jgi:UDPglucose--hexose-1-phosphate uridylyltransferase
MDLERHVLVSTMLDPAGTEVTTKVEVRTDPLTGHTSRILPDRGLMPPNDLDLEAFARENQPKCPFCSDRLERLTPRLSPEISAEGRITRGEAVLFPNLHAYSSHSSVSVYSPRLHFLPLAQMTSRLVTDNLATQVEFARAVMDADPDSRWASVNANHMLPAGSSLFHPHLQGIVDSRPTTMQRLLADVRPERFDAYLKLERHEGVRYLGNTGRIEWLASFAPIAPAELRAFISGRASPAELDQDEVAELGYGLALALNGYADLGFESFNLALYGALPGTDGYVLNLRLGARSNLRAFYRSDSTLLERLHWEGAIDLPPEMIAEQLAPKFST